MNIREEKEKREESYFSPYAQKRPPIPVAMTDAVPETSRFLDALEKRYNEENRMAADAISFGSYRKKEVSAHV